MRKSKKRQQADEVDFLVGTLMISTKRATQAGEFFRRTEASFVKQIQRNMAKLDRWKKRAEDHSQVEKTSELRRWTQDIFIECALLELIIADGLSFET